MIKPYQLSLDGVVSPLIPLLLPHFFPSEISIVQSYIHNTLYATSQKFQVFVLNDTLGGLHNWGAYKFWWRNQTPEGLFIGRGLHLGAPNLGLKIGGGGYFQHFSS